MMFGSVGCCLAESSQYSTTQHAPRAAIGLTQVAWHSNTCYGNRYQRGRSADGRTSGLPGGRRYYNGRYFGNFNNRFYGPQYGYF